MERLSEFNFLQFHHIHGCRLPEFQDNYLKTLNEWYESFSDARHKLNAVQSFDFIEVIDVHYVKEIIKDLSNIYFKEYPHSDIDDFFDFVLTTTYYELKSFVENGSRMVWSGLEINGIVIYYFVNQCGEREYFGINEKYDLEYINGYYKRLIKEFDSLLKTLKDNESIDAPTIQSNNEEFLNTPFKDAITKRHFEFLVENWNYKKDLKFSYIFNYFERIGANIYLYKTDYERYIRSNFGFTGKFQYEHANSEKNYQALTDLTIQFRKI